MAWRLRLQLAVPGYLNILEEIMIRMSVRLLVVSLIGLALFTAWGAGPVFGATLGWVMDLGLAGVFI
jgi:hypothetical protein